MIKILKASSYYASYLRWFYNQRPHLINASYARQHSELMYDSFSLSDSWRKHLGVGNFSVTEIVVNAEFLQKAWAKENNIKYRESNWLEDIFLAQLYLTAPAVLYAHASEITPDIRCRCRKLLDRDLFVITYDGVARNSLAVSAESDLVITCLNSSCDYYKAHGANSYIMKFGFDPDILNCLNENINRTPVSFVGSINLRTGHNNRAITLAQIAKGVDYDCWISGIPNDAGLLRLWGAFVRSRNCKGFLNYLPAALCARRLRDRSHGELYGLEMFSRLAASNITINSHINAAGNQAANIRLFEATGVGTCLVTDWKDNITELFKPDYEIITYKSADEAIEKIRFLLKNEAVCREIGARGQKRTLNDHSYAARLSEFGAYLLSII